VHVGLPPRLAFHRVEDHHEVFVRAELSRALDGDVEAWNERRQAQPVEDADAEIQDSHRTDSRRESPGRYLTSVCGRRPRNLERRPRGRRFVKALLAAYPLPPVASGEGTLGVDVGTGACTVCPSALFDVNDEREPMNRLGPLRV